MVNYNRYHTSTTAYSHPLQRNVTRIMQIDSAQLGGDKFDLRQCGVTHRFDALKNIPDSRRDCSCLERCYFSTLLGSYWQLRADCGDLCTLGETVGRLVLRECFVFCCYVVFELQFLRINVGMCLLYCVDLLRLRYCLCLRA